LPLYLMPFVQANNMTDVILKVENLVKNFGKFRAVDGISFSVPRGKIVGFLGPNGAGKTTTIHMLLGVTSKTSGSISYFGDNFDTHRETILKRINFASAFNTLQNRITVWENLVVFSLLYEVRNYTKKIEELCNHFEIESLFHKRYNDLSSGQRTRVNLVKSLLNDPELILMDEPTASLDPDITDKTLTLIEKLKKEKNLTLLYTSHNMDEITRICDEVIFLDHGKIVAQDTPLGLTKRVKNAELRLEFDGKEKILKKYLNEKKSVFSFPNPNTVVVKVEEKKIPEIIFGLSQSGVWITDIEVIKPSLEDVFLQIARSKKHDKY